jgi:hypothetical protein
MTIHDTKLQGDTSKMLHHSANLMVRIFFNGEPSSSSLVSRPRASRYGCSSSTATIASDADSGSWDVPSAAADPARSGILSITGSYVFSCM